MIVLSFASQMMHSEPMHSVDDEEIRRNSTPRRVRLILLTLA